MVKPAIKGAIVAAPIAMPIKLPRIGMQLINTLNSPTARPIKTRMAKKPSMGPTTSEKRTCARLKIALRSSEYWFDKPSSPLVRWNGSRG